MAPFDATSRVKQKLRLRPKAGDRPFRWASATMQAEVRGTFSELGFNGKIDRFGVHARLLSDEEPRRDRGRWRPARRGRGRALGHDGGRDDGIDDVVRDSSRTGCTAAASTGPCAR